MGILEAYLILDVSFCIMWYFRYTLEIDSVIWGTLEELEATHSHSSWIYKSTMTILCFIIFPAFFIIMLSPNRWDVITYLAKARLEKIIIDTEV